MSETGAYYTQERWQNWLDRLRDEEVDPDDDQAARLFFNLIDDATIAVAKIIRSTRGRCQRRRPTPSSSESARSC